MRVIDTNVLAYLVIDGPHTAGARKLFDRDADWHTEFFALVELTNVLTTNVRAGRLSLLSAARALSTAESIVMGGLHSVEHAAVLKAAADLRISAYDARYLALAAELGEPLVTEDMKLRRVAPDFTQSIADALRDT